MTAKYRLEWSKARLIQINNPLVGRAAKFKPDIMLFVDIGVTILG